jgi:hypothetical protein
MLAVAAAVTMAQAKRSVNFKILFGKMDFYLLIYNRNST